MPCRYYDEDCNSNLGHVCNHTACRAEVDTLTEFLCQACKLLGPVGVAKLTPDAQHWWARHQVQDAKRVAKEEAEKVARQQQRQLKESALGKLSAAERKALGI